MGIGSRINPLLTLEYMRTEGENKYFDRKSGKIRATELAPHISAFANADGGTLVIGISDKRRILEGINSCGEDKINEFINAPKDCCRPMPRYREEFIDITNVEGKPDRLLLLHIEQSMDQVIRMSNDRTYLRIGDKSKEMLGENLRNLEYAKGSRHFEDEINQNAIIEDLDEELLTAYKKHIGAEELNTAQVLSARGFLVNRDGKDCLTNAAVLLFAKNVMQFYPQCRLRFIRVAGRELQVGADYNVVKDKSIDAPVLRIVDQAKDYIKAQLRDFTAQDKKTGKFIESPEYPEFSWLEGIINAVAHRDYAMRGAFIKVSMFDDRLEIESPGRLPDIVTVDNIQYTRFSRNSQISRVMTEFGFVRELNEGVKKIFSDMENAGLKPPEYKDFPNTLILTLRNDIDARTKQKNKTSDKTSDEVLFEGLNDDEKVLIEIIRKAPHATQEFYAREAVFSLSKVQRIMKKLQKEKIIWRKGAKKNGTWEIS